MAREQKKFVDERPKSKALFERARKSLLAGVPMNWMVEVGGGVSAVCARGAGRRTSSTSTGIATSISVWATPER